MSQGSWPNGLSADLADLAGRRDALRQAAAMPGADPDALLDAAFTELDAAVEVLTKLIQAAAGEPDRPAGEALPVSLSAERSLLRAVFQHAPAPLFVLEPDGTIRRANGRAGDLIGAPSGYATGKPLTAFVDLASRAAVQSQLAAAARTGTARQADATLLGPAGPVPATLTANVIPLPDDTRLLIVTVTAAGDQGSPRRFPGDSPGGVWGGGSPPGAGGIGGSSPLIKESPLVKQTRRMDMVTAVTRLLLDNSTFSEAVTLQRCARLLAGDIASWVVVDVDRSDYEDRFVTAKLAYLRWDGDHVRVELASSGHPGPAVVRADGRVDVLSGGGLPLGLFPDAEPERETLELGQDDLLFFYSDGVTEARSPDMQYFEDRLADELAGTAGQSAAETARMVQGLVTRFTQDDLRDDMTILVAKVTSPPGTS